MNTPLSPVRRDQVEVAGTPLSYLSSGDEHAAPLVLLHGTFWSRVWLPVLPALGTARRCIALDLPGFGRSGGELDISDATVPSLAETVLATADALGLDSFDLAGHDIGGGIAQHIAATSGRVNRLVLMNSVMFDSWPVPAVERFRDPEVRAATTAPDLLNARAVSTQRAVKRTLTPEELNEYLSPWTEPARHRSWMAMAAAADARYTLDLVPLLQKDQIPTRLVWGRDDEFQEISFACRYVREIRGSDLVEVDGKHIPTEDSPAAVAQAILDHLGR
ncbi:alpha/beta hydrolase [Pseudarthrobacter sp. NPDC080039]|uniref:alpha/beta fold hydrolase n=1 Tax=unclassified Pseudarthrobacter TaxID=2647000 RepID=UPI00344FB5EA